MIVNVRIGPVVLLLINVIHNVQLLDTAELPVMQEPTAKPIHSKEGDSALMTCVVRNLGDHTVLWKTENKDRQGLKVLTAAESRITADRRFEVLHDKGGDVWVLSIKNVKFNDSGLYACEVNSDPVVRSFHSLSVLSGNLEPPPFENGTAAYYGKEDESEPIDIKNHNYTDCCVARNVSSGCLGFCNIQSILDGTTGQDPENCEPDFKSIVKCMADGRNHVPCCVQEGIPDICQDVCQGEYTPITDNIKTMVSCSPYTEQTLACIVEGIEILPSQPEDVQVDVNSSSMVFVTWDKPSANSASVKGYVVNVTMLRSFDGMKTFPDNDGNSQSIVTPHSIQVKVPGSEYEVKIDKLIPFTMYEITVVAVNKHGSSLPSTAIRSLTLNSDQKTSRRTNTDNSTLPPLPDIRSCCMKKGITHSACLDKLCDPSRSDVAEVTDLMICAPWASQTFSCLTNGIDHTPCCRARGLPPLCQNLCAGNLTQIDFSYFKCLRFMDDYTSCLLQGYGIVASAPRRLRVSNVDVNFALFHWEPPKDLADTVTHYNVFYRLVDDEYDSITNVHSPFILEHLNANTLYEVYVEAVNGHGAGEPSQRVVFSTKSQIANDRELTTSPYNLTDCCVNIKLRQMCMPLCSFDANMTDVRSLAPFCGAELHKLIKCGAGGRNHGACCTRRGVPGICTPLCSGVVPDSLLSVAVNCASFIGNVVQCFEEGTGKLPGPVGDMHAVKLTNSSVSLVWNPPNDNSNVTSFVVHYQKVNNSTVHENTIKLDQQMEVNENSVVLIKLETGKLYKVFVVSKNIHGTSLPSSILLLNITETDLDGKGVVGVTSPPHSLSVSAHSANYVTITWQPPEFSHVSEEITYKLYWKSVAETVFHQIDVAVPAYTVENLSPNSQYIIYIVAMSKNGKSLPSETLIAWTDPAYPAFVEPPTVHPINLVMEGSSMTVLCIAMGTPSPTISLYISGRLVRQETSRHMVTVIHNVTRDMDEISCYADNGYGTPMQSSRKISISYVPKLVASKITMANLGDTVTLECMVDAHPEPKTMFWRDAQGRTPVIQSGKHNVNVIRSKEDYTKFVMELTISKLTETDDGDYFCHAENSFGSSTKPVSVRIRNSVMTNNVTQCCVQQNVTAGCLDACSSSYLDINVAIGRADCFNDFDKLMKCASDGSDHRACCSDRGVPRRCLEWCRGEPVNNKMCVLSYSKSILACFHELRDKLPGPPTNVRLENVDAHTITVKWDPPAKNPQTVEVYRVFWRRVGNNSPPEKNDTKETSMKISGLKDDLTYELVLKAGNSRGMSTLTEPIRFTTAEKDVTSAASMGESRADIGTIFGVFVAILIVGGIVAGVVYYMHGHGNLLHKSSSGVSFENPSYLREVNMENMNHTDLPYSGPTNGLNTAEWKQDHLHTATEVPPTLYEELKLGSDGAGFKRLKP
ncbi:Ig-like and fibronectin type-III domain-containing protein 1 [Metopolophium dirhodum]|uniref:Ig-like and fibronectin type-III domain-containing protein 1 n=1 Tax=Metopolophium dirhodum TaxID=44670 RepID=UPI00298F64C6|nr:Ig-like and fibronectin type-III domain-containing protein 1 [Metopolophium dirhodum]XP_060866862.1 Ig-like and fibronectin type-III domain-containing protein 1 [Metopolophium dirhodum]